MYQEVCFNRGTEAGGGVNVGHSLSPQSLCLLRVCCLKRRFKLVEPITGDHPVKLPKTLFASWAVRCLLFVMLCEESKISGFLGLRWLDTVFQGQYPSSLSINYVAINKDLEKLPPQLYCIKMKICCDQGWHWSCHNNEMMPLPILLAAVFLVTGNCSSKLVHGSFFLQ